jgi:hypothetical protein
MTRNERGAAAAVDNIENALIDLEIFCDRRTTAVALIDSIIAEMNEEGVASHEQFTFDFWQLLRNHLLDLNAQEELEEFDRELESIQRNENVTDA